LFYSLTIVCFAQVFTEHKSDVNKLNFKSIYDVNIDQKEFSARPLKKLSNDSLQKIENLLFKQGSFTFGHNRTVNYSTEIQANGYEKQGNRV